MILVVTILIVIHLNINTNSTNNTNRGFRKPGQSEPLFPLGGLDLRWRWDASCGHIVIDFFREQDKTIKQ